MAGNKKKSKGKPHRQLPPGMTYADVLAMEHRQVEAIREAAESDAVRIKTEEVSARNMWIMIISLGDAFGFGPKRIERFINAFVANVDEFSRMKETDGEEFAIEKLRQRAEKVTGSKIAYVSDEEYDEAMRRQEDHNEQN